MEEERKSKFDDRLIDIVFSFREDRERYTSHKDATVPPTTSKLNLILLFSSGSWPNGAGNPHAPCNLGPTLILPSELVGFAGSFIKDISRSCEGSKWHLNIRSASP